MTSAANRPSKRRHTELNKLKDALRVFEEGSRLSLPEKATGAGDCPLYYPRLLNAGTESQESYVTNQGLVELARKRLRTPTGRGSSLRDCKVSVRIRPEALRAGETAILPGS